MEDAICINSTAERICNSFGGPFCNAIRMYVDGKLGLGKKAREDIPLQVPDKKLKNLLEKKKKVVLERVLQVLETRIEL